MKLDTSMSSLVSSLYTHTLGFSDSKVYPGSPSTPAALSSVEKVLRGPSPESPRQFSWRTLLQIPDAVCAPLTSAPVRPSPGVPARLSLGSSPPGCE